MPGEDEGSTKEPGLEELIKLSRASEMSGLSAGHLRYLVRRGEMWGIKLGRDWFTTAKALSDYLAQDRRPGPKG